MTGHFFVSIRTLACGFCTLAILANSGCGKGPAVPDLFPVSGTVKFEGKPLAGAKITFISAAEDPKKPPKKGTVFLPFRPAAETDEEGNYGLTWGENEGAPAGKYKVMISSCGEFPPDYDGESAAPPSLIPERYSNPSTSGLTAEITEDDENVVNFELVP